MIQKVCIKESSLNQWVPRTIHLKYSSSLNLWCLVKIEIGSLDFRNHVNEPAFHSYGKFHFAHLGF